MIVEDIFNEKVSIYQNLQTSAYANYTKIGEATILNVLKNLHHFKDISNELKSIHDEYLLTKDSTLKVIYDEKKKLLKGATFSALFKDHRGENEEKTLTHTIMLDIDHIRDEQHLSISYVKNTLMELTGVYYCQCSASGNGVWALAAVENPTDRVNIFNYYKKQLLKKGIILDKLADISRIRYLTYDENYLFKSKNFNMLVLPKIDTNQIKFHTKQPIIPLRKIDEYKIIEECINNGYTVNDYKSWVASAMSIAGILGSNGQDLFIKLCEQSNNFKNRKECEKLYNNAIKKTNKRTTIGYYISILKSLKKQV